MSALWTSELNFSHKHLEPESTSAGLRLEYCLAKVGIDLKHARLTIVELSWTSDPLGYLILVSLTCTAARGVQQKHGLLLSSTEH